jgi:low affinity Fe/Cu permease
MPEYRRADPRGTRVERFKRGKIRPGPIRLAFTRFASATAEAAGTHWTFLIAIVLILGWLVSGPLFGWSDTWQLLANTFTTLVTFLMVFIIQNTQTREAKAMHLKLDELIRAVPQARDEFMEAEEEDLEEILREKAIVDRADPAPPDSADQRRQRRERTEGQRQERKAG